MAAPRAPVFRQALLRMMPSMNLHAMLSSTLDRAITSSTTPPLISMPVKAAVFSTSMWETVSPAVTVKAGSPDGVARFIKGLGWPATPCTLIPSSRVTKPFGPKSSAISEYSPGASTTSSPAVTPPSLSAAVKIEHGWAGLVQGSAPAPPGAANLVAADALAAAAKTKPALRRASSADLRSRS
jgi:hypothetical protein